MDGVEIILASLKEFRKYVSNARCLAGTRQRANELADVLNAVDELNDCIIKYLK